MKGQATNLGNLELTCSDLPLSATKSSRIFSNNSCCGNKLSLQIQSRNRPKETLFPSSLEVRQSIQPRTTGRCFLSITSFQSFMNSLRSSGRSSKNLQGSFKKKCWTILTRKLLRRSRHKKAQSTMLPELLQGVTRR